MNPSRAARGVLAAGAAAFVIAVTVASRNPGPRAWALHLPGFLPYRAGFFVMALLVGGAALLAIDFLRGGTATAGRGPRPKVPSHGRGSKRRATPELSPRRSARSPWALLLWRLEARTHFLGDGTVWLDRIGLGYPNPFTEPLAAAVWAGYASVLRSMGVMIDPVTAGLLPIFFGVIAAALFWGIASEITPKGGSRAAVFAVLATMGLVQLYFGYIESYPVVSVAILAYLWLGLRRARGADHPIWLALALAVAIASHLSCLLLAPSYLALLLREKRPWPGRAALTLVPPAVTALLLALLGYPPSRWLGALRIAAGALEAGHVPAPYVRPYAAVSLDHAWDLLNAILLAFPVPALLLLAAVAGGAARRETIAGPTAPREKPPGGLLGDPAAVFLAVAALPGLLLAGSVVLLPPPAQDWDLTSVLLLPLAIFGIKEGVSISSVPIRGARAVGLALLGGGALLSFVLVNANEESGIRRYETLIGPGAKITGFGRAYGNEVLATYDADREDFARALVHASRALDAEPGNPRYWVKKGAALYGLGRYQEAIPVLREGIRRGPARGDAYYNLGNCLAKTGQYPEAVANYREAIRRGEPRPDYYNNLGVALYYSGSTDSARVMWTEVVRRWPWYTLSRRALLQHFGSGGADSAGVTSAPG